MLMFWNFSFYRNLVDLENEFNLEKKFVESKSLVMKTIVESSVVVLVLWYILKVSVIWKDWSGWLHLLLSLQIIRGGLWKEV